MTLIMKIISYQVLDLYVELSMPRATLEHRDSYYSHFKDEETEAQRAMVT